MNMITFLCLSALSVGALQAQSWSQPVREVEKGARSAVRGYCNVAVNAPHNQASADCTMLRAADTQAQSVVPAGQHLVVEDVSAYCRTFPGEFIATLTIDVAPPSSMSWSRYIPLATQGSTNGVSPYTFRVGSVASRFYAPPGARVTVNAFTGPAVETQAVCTVRFAGHLVSAQ